MCGAAAEFAHQSGFGRSRHGATVASSFAGVDQEISASVPSPAALGGTVAGQLNQVVSRRCPEIQSGSWVKQNRLYRDWQGAPLIFLPGYAHRGVVGLGLVSGSYKPAPAPAWSLHGR
jgi:hypothetical protein